MYLYRWILGSTVAATLSVTVFGCTSVYGISSDPTVAVAEPTTCQGSLYVRIATDFSGTATDIAIPHFWGIYDYMRRLNEGGGIRGCPIDIQVEDNYYTPAQTTVVVDKWRATDPHWADVSTLFIFGTGPTTAVGPELMAEKKLIIPGSYAGSLAAPDKVTKQVSYPVVNTSFQSAEFSVSKTSSGWPYVFYPATDYGTGMRLAIQAAWTIHPGRMGLAHETSDKCAYCVEPLAAGASFLPSLEGMSLGRDLIFPQTSSPNDQPTIVKAVNDYFMDAVTGEVVHFKQANATSYTYDPVSWLWSGNSVYASAILGKQVAAVQKLIDADPEITRIISTNKKSPWKIRVIANNWGIGETTTTICGADCNGDLFYGLFPVPRYADLQNSSGMATLIALHDAFASKDVGTPLPAPITPRAIDQYRDVRYVQGYAAALMWDKAVNRALDAGHSKITGEDLKNALEGFVEEDMKGMTAGPISFTAKDHRPQSNESIYKVDDNGQLQFVQRFSVALVSDWLGY